MIKEIFNVRYQMDMGCGLDVWRIVGEYNGKDILPSIPVSFDTMADIFETASGSKYHIATYACAKDSFSKQIVTDIVNKSYERH